MSNYESTFICSPELPAEKLEELIKKAKKVIENSGGQIVLSQQLGKKRLAYPIQRFREGYYIYFEILGDGESVQAIENFYRVNDSVIRYLTVKAEKKKVQKKTKEPVESSSEEVKSDELNKSTSTGS